MAGLLRVLESAPLSHAFVLGVVAVFGIFRLQGFDRFAPGIIRPLKNGNLLRQRKNPDRLCMANTPRVLDFFASLYLSIFSATCEF
jgi:hypothetical protein